MLACATLALALTAVSADQAPTNTGLVVRMVANSDAGTAKSSPVVIAFRDTGADDVSGTPPRYTRSSFESVLKRSQEPATAEPMLPMPPPSEPLMFGAAPHSASYSSLGSVETNYGTVYEDAGFCPECCGSKFGHKCRGKLHAWKSVLKPDMAPHTPYRALPAEYYYFRPYNIMHIPQHQEEVVQYGEDPRMPYENSVFTEDLYEGLDDMDGVKGEDIEPAPAEPMPPKATPEPPPTPPNGSARRGLIRPASAWFRISGELPVSPRLSDELPVGPRQTLQNPLR